MVLALLENRKIILGSNSPRRRELLAMLGVSFDVVSPTCDEKLNENLSIFDAIIDVSKRKALSIISDDIVITADTLVVLDDKILGKPFDRDDAFNMLSILSDNTHKVLTAVTIKNRLEIQSFLVETDVTFYKLDNQDINSYLDTSEPYDKAGSYGIQGLGGLFVKQIKGDYYSVVGLPISRLYNKLKNIQ